MTCGIYCITNKLNGKQYIGQSNNIEKRWKDHQYQHDDTHFHRAIDKYGIENFDFDILCECGENELNSEEINFIKLYGTFHQGYNLTKGGEGTRGFTSRHKGKHIHTNESKMKISKKNKGKPAWNKGKHLSDDTKRKLSEARKGKKWSEEVKRKISESQKGKVMSDDAKRRISESQKGKIMPEETKIKISKSKNTTGYYRVSRCEEPRVKQGFIWRYYYYTENRKQVSISSVNLSKLKEKVLAKGLKWNIIDEQKAMENGLL